MAEFVPRLTAPPTDHPYYYSNTNPLHRDGYGLPNCTCYAWGRFYEIFKTRPKLCLGNAELWYKYKDGYERGQTPKLGAVAVWSRGVIGDESDGAGHVAIVEAIAEDGTITTSNSAWQGTLFYTETIAPPYKKSGNRNFEGFIYGTIDFNPEYNYGEMPEPISDNRYLSMSEMKTNAAYIYYTLYRRGWTPNAIAAMLGNMQTESTINPGIWEGLDSSDASRGYGLVQWTPSTKYTDWCAENDYNPASLDAALARIEWELENGEQWISTETYPMTFEEFKKSTQTASYLAKVFLNNYERPAESEQPARGTQAVFWYNYITALPRLTTRKGLPLWLMYAATRKKRKV